MASTFRFTGLKNTQGKALLAFTFLSSLVCAPFTIAEQSPPINTQQNPFVVEKQTVFDLKSVFASVQSMDTTHGRARISGTLVELIVDEGDLVEAGQKIAKVIDAKQKLQIAALTSKLRSYRAQQKLAKTTLRRITTLHRSQKASQAELDKAKTNVDVINANIAALKLDQAVILELQSQGDVLAPTKGRILSVNVTQGTVVMPGESIASLAADSYILRLLLPERHARFIKTGDSVLVAERGMLDTGNNTQQRKGIISQVYPELDNGRVVADVEVDGLGDFFVGERIRVWVSTDKREAFIIPESYVHRRYGLSFARLASGTEIVVQPGSKVNGGIEILSGLQAGDTLVKKGGQPAPSYSNN